jgi:hypothetical protein|tara:strand:- start:515 stop:700 length:186 start_codon:yes stop_codon:yes gene_type:complete
MDQDIIQYSSSFTLLKTGVDYKQKFEETLEKFQYEQLDDKVARHWIAQCMYDILLKDTSNR